MYQKPEFLELDGLAEGIFAGSGDVTDSSTDTTTDTTTDTSTDTTTDTASGCGYTNATVEINEQDFNKYKTRFTVKADHTGTTNDKRGVCITLQFSDYVQLSCRTSRFYNMGIDLGTTFVIYGNVSHHSQVNCEFSAYGMNGSTPSTPSVTVVSAS